MQISMSSSDNQILTYIGKANNVDCSVDRNKNSYSVIMNCMVKQIRHMFDASSEELESMAILVPVNRIVENVIIYLTDPSKCDPRFVKLVQSTAA